MVRTRVVTRKNLRDLLFPTCLARVLVGKLSPFFRTEKTLLQVAAIRPEDEFSPRSHNRPANHQQTVPKERKAYPCTRTPLLPYYLITVVWLTRSWVRLYAAWLLALPGFLVGKIWPDKCPHGLPGNGQRAQCCHVQSLPFAQCAGEGQAAQLAHVVVDVA